MKLDRLRRFALALPDTTEEPHFHYGSFRVRGKIFVTLPPEGTHVHVFAPEDERERAVAMYPEAIERLRWGQKVVGVRIALASAPADEVERLVLRAWEAKAPKRLAAQRKADAGD